MDGSTTARRVAAWFRGAGLGLAFAVGIAGCRRIPVASASEAAEVSVTPLEEMTPPPFTYLVEMTPEVAVYWVLGFFALREILAFTWLEGSTWRLRSKPLEEPEKDHRYGRVTYLVRIRPYPDRNDCSVVEIRWFLERRGYDDLAWVQASDPSEFPPRSAAPLAATLVATPCLNQH